MVEDQYNSKDIERARWEGATTQQLNDISSSMRYLQEAISKKADKVDLVTLKGSIDSKADQSEFNKLDDRIGSLEKKVYIGMGILAALQVFIRLI